MELKKVEFALERKGYSTSQVDDYINYLVSKCEELERSRAELEKRYRAVQIKLEEAKNDENTISAIIVNAQKMADSLVNDAKAKAKAVTDSLNDSCNEILSSFAEKAALEQDKLARAKASAAEFKESLYEAYRTHISNIESIMPDSDDDTDDTEKTSDELVDEALDLAQRKYEDGESSEPEIIARRAEPDEE